MKKRRWDLNLSKAQRMQLKALACILGLLLIIILLIARLVISLMDREEPEVHIPVITELENIWIMEVEGDGLLVFQDGEARKYPFGMVTHEEGEEAVSRPYEIPQGSREQVADITLTDGAVTHVRVKSEKVSGKVLSAGPEAVEIEGVGRLPVTAGAKGYRLYDTLSMCSVTDVLIGYDFNDFVVDNGEICAVLMVKEEAMEYIRVLLKSADFGGRFHESISFTADTEYIVRYGAYDNMAEEVHSAGEVCTIDGGSAYFQSDRITIAPSVLTGKITLTNVTRSQGAPAYRGSIELVKTPEGIVAVNEVLLEEYLYSVVPSEMPASYPAEALKAQAVCARTYAYSHMINAGYPQYGAHVDDSTSYQVYNNILEQEATTTASKETYGQLLYTENREELAGAYYYSTSCGLGSDATVWKSGSGESLTYLQARAINHTTMERLVSEWSRETEDGHTDASSEVKQDEDMIGRAMTEEETFAEFIQKKNADDFEATEGWYRWTYTVNEIDTEHMLEALQKRYEANERFVLTLNNKGEYVSQPVGALGKIKELRIVKRGSGGVAEELMIRDDKHTYKVITEHNIRYVLNDGVTKILRQDGSEIASPNLLPSGFFIIDAGMEKEDVVSYKLTGGGYGHGVGMSQNGARAMAKAGYSAEDILRFFYKNCVLSNVYEEDPE